jgi:hypothetical protein
VSVGSPVERTSLSPAFHRQAYVMCIRCDLDGVAELGTSAAAFLHAGTLSILAI